MLAAVCGRFPTYGGLSTFSFGLLNRAIAEREIVRGLRNLCVLPQIGSRFDKGEGIDDGGKLS